MTARDERANPDRASVTTLTSGGPTGAGRGTAPGVGLPGFGLGAEQELREWLREGDPLSEDAPSEDDSRRLRARVLRAAEQQRLLAERQSPAIAPLPRPALLLVGAIIFAVAAIFVSWLAPWAPSPSGSREARTHDRGLQQPVPASQPTRSPAVSSGLEAPRDTTSSARPEPFVKPSPVRPRPFDSQPSVRPDVVEGPTGPLQIQFTTPGGTRIVWVLNPDLTLQAPQQED